MKVWHQLERVLHDEQPYTFIRVAPWIRFVKQDVGNVNAYKTALEPWEFFLPGAEPSRRPHLDRAVDRARLRSCSTTSYAACS